MKTVPLKKMIVFAAVLTAGAFAQAEQLYSLRQICGSVRTVNGCNAVPFCALAQAEGRCVQTSAPKISNPTLHCSQLDRHSCQESNPGVILGCTWREPVAKYSCVPAQ